MMFAQMKFLGYIFVSVLLVVAGCDGNSPLIFAGQPSDATPEIRSSGLDVMAPEPTEPEVTVHEPPGPEVIVPEPSEADVRGPEPSGSELSVSVTPEPEIVVANASESGVVVLVGLESEALIPESIRPELTVPEISEPEVVFPEVLEAELTGSEPAGPEAIDFPGYGCDYFPGPVARPSADQELSINGSHEVLTSDIALGLKMSFGRTAAVDLDIYLTLEIYDRVNYEPLSNVGNVSTRTLPIELTGGDQVVVLSNGERKVLEDMPISNGYSLYKGYGNYYTTIDSIRPGDCIRVAIERSNGQAQALETVITLPAFPEVTSPVHGESYAMEDDIIIDWGVSKVNGDFPIPPLKSIITELRCIDDGGKYKRVGSDSDLFDVANNPRPPYTVKMSDLAGPIYLDRYGNSGQMNLSGCQVVFDFVPEIESDVKIHHDPALYNSQMIDYYFRPRTSVGSIRRIVEIVE